MTARQREAETVRLAGEECKSLREMLKLSHERETLAESANRSMARRAIEVRREEAVSKREPSPPRAERDRFSHTPAMSGGQYLEVLRDAERQRLSERDEWNELDKRLRRWESAVQRESQTSVASAA